MKQRLKKIRKDAQLTQTEFGKFVCASQYMITSYETGRVIPDDSMVELICLKFGVNRQWLETGEGYPYREDLFPRIVRVLLKYPSLKSAVEQILDSMNPDEWEMLDMVVKKTIDRKNVCINSLFLK